MVGSVTTRIDSFS